jgi:Kef-type K+ transport system membrane component KefB
MPHIASYFPITDPTLIFFVVLLIILMAPIVMGKLRIPHIVGMVLAGTLIGPHGLGILEKDSSFNIFGNVGLYFIMLLAALEMNMEDMRHNRTKTITHGLLAFAIPLLMGLALNSAVLHYSLITSILLASMYASHTLIAYPTVMRFGLSQERSVTIAVGATALTDTLTLLTLAIIVAMADGNITGWFGVLLVLKTALVFALIIFFFPRMARKFFVHYENIVIQFILCWH